MAIKILYIEDELFLGKVVKEALEHKLFEVQWITDGAKVMEALLDSSPDICILDVMLPNIDGFTLGKEIKMKMPELPIIFLTAKSQTEDVLEGFKSGGTDYLRKPFSMEELLVRIQNQLHIFQKLVDHDIIELDSFQISEYTFSPKKYELKYKDNVYKLSHKDVQLLMLFVKHKNKMIDRKKILLDVWGDDSFFNSRNLDVYISKLREYFKSDSKINIQTLKGVGYHFVVENQ